VDPVSIAVLLAGASASCLALFSAGSTAKDVRRSVQAFEQVVGELASLTPGDREVKETTPMPGLNEVIAALPVRQALLAICREVDRLVHAAAGYDETVLERYDQFCQTLQRLTQAAHNCPESSIPKEAVQTILAVSQQAARDLQRITARGA
jgi:hypothetical protein